MNQRRTSKGRSSIMDMSITTLRDMLKDDRCDLDEVITMVVNNTLPNELRSILWRIQLGILPKDKHYSEWVEIIQKERKIFDSLINDQDIQNYLKVIRKESDVDILPSGELFNDFKLIKESILQIPGTSHDFFKSESVQETFLTLYIIWKKNNPNIITKNLQPFNILAGLIYCLYPSILHHTYDPIEIKGKEDIDVRTLYYFLNDEEYFDSDVYLIFDTIMKSEQILKNINNFENENWQDVEFIKEKIVFKENLFPLSEESKGLISKLNRCERIGYLYLKIVNEGLLNNLINNKIPFLFYIQSLYSTLLICSIPFENLSYLWDNIFTFSDVESPVSFSFLDFVILSLFNNLHEAYLHNLQEVPLKYPEHKLDSKRILGKALKFKEKILEELDL